MNIIEVAVPMMRGRRRFHVEKGRRWSVIEHLMLEAVNRAPSTTAQLSQQSKLHRRIVVEAFIRLMRVGWVEILGDTKATVFSATPAGRSQIESGGLKDVTTVRPRPMSFAFDQVTGQVFRGSELSIRLRHRIVKSPESHILVFLDKSPRHAAEDLNRIYSALEGENEVIIGTDSSPYLPVEGYAVVRVVGGVIDELPARAEAPLRAAILKAASSAMPASEPGSVRQTPLDQAQPTSTPSQSVEALFDHNDLVLGGTDHERTFFEAFGRARENVVVHSTFISENHKAYLAPMLAAAARNVRIDILWGQSDDKTENSTSRTSATNLRRAIQEAGRSEQIRVHTLSTDSHAKILASDDGRGGWATVLGSCNWLSTDFASFETSVRLRDPALAGEIINHLANLSLGSRGVWHPLADDLTVLARRISAAKTQTGRKAKLRVLLAPDHASLLLEARDRAQRRIVITSHRIGIAGQPMAIVPAVAAAQAKDVDASLYFGRATGPLSGVNAAELTREFERQGVHIRPIFQPRLHAKTLSWDDDALAVTSQNWLSASSSQNSPRREIGIFIELNKIADTFIRRFEHARSQF